MKLKAGADLVQHLLDMHEVMFNLQQYRHKVGWYMSVTPALGRWREENELKVILTYIGS